MNLMPKDLRRPMALWELIERSGLAGGVYG
jgi:hypothetical protein